MFSQLWINIEFLICSHQPQFSGLSWYTKFLIEQSCYDLTLPTELIASLQQATDCFDNEWNWIFGTIAIEGGRNQYLAFLWVGQRRNMDDMQMSAS